MKSSNSLAVLATIACVLFAAAFACNSGTSETPSNTASNSASTKPSNSNTSGKKVDISGDYDASGTNPDGNGKYTAQLKVTPHDDVYQFTWLSGKNSYDGVGVMTDNEVAVSFTDGGSGKGCGVVLYQIGSDGALDGKVGYWGVNSMETEHATRTSGTDLEGEYEITGKNPEGKEYKGKLKVKQEGQGYGFSWDTGSSLEGFGLKAGNLVAVGFGGKQCSFVGYDVKDDGTLQGRWGSQDATTFGTEVATKKK